METTTMRRSVVRAVAATAALAVLLLAAGVAPAAAQTERVDPLPPQPDLLVSKNGTTYIGDGVYNATGAGQAMSRNAARGTTVRFYVRAQNDGEQAAQFVMRGCAGNGTFRVRYFGLVPGVGAVDFTDAVINGDNDGTYSAGIDTPWMVEVKVKATAAAGATLNCKLKLNGIVDPLQRDAVLMTVRRS